jgi:uncharacterized protein with PIN domain
MEITKLAEEDIHVIRTCVSLFLKSRNGPARDMMARSIRYILNQYGIPRLQLDTFSVRATGKKFAVVEGIDWISGDRRCPSCEAPIYGDDSKVAILSIRENQPEGFDECSYGCVCGRIFRKLEKNE